MTWLPHRHRWTLWEPVWGGIFPGLLPGSQERQCEGCGWTQRARIDMVAPPSRPAGTTPKRGGMVPPGSPPPPPKSRTSVPNPFPKINLT